MFASWAVAVVGNAAQFWENPLILQNQASPSCVEVVARAGLREVVRHGLLAILVYIIAECSFKLIGVYIQKRNAKCKGHPLFLNVRNIYRYSHGIILK